MTGRSRSPGRHRLGRGADTAAPTPSAGARTSGLRRSAAAFADVGPSSAASLVVGLLAVRLLSPTELGVYSMLYACAFLVGVAPTQLVFLPRERSTATGALDPVLAARHAWRLLGRSTVVGLLAGVVTVGLAAYLYGQHPSSTTLLLGAGAVPLGLASPVQDYVRRLAHILDRGLIAVVTSAVQLAIVALLGAVAWGMGARDTGAWLIVALAVSNAASAAAGLALLARNPGTTSALDPRPPGPADDRADASADRARVVGGLVPDVSFTLGNLLLERFGGLAAVGAAEAARQLAQPVMLVGMAASNVLARRTLRAGAYGDAAAAFRARRLAAAGAVGAVLVVLAVCYLPPGASLVREFAPIAFANPWLITVTCLAHAVVVVGMVLTLELMGAHRELTFLRVESAAAVSLLALCSCASLLGAAARPIAVLVQGCIRLTASGRSLAGRYAAGPYQRPGIPAPAVSAAEAGPAITPASGS